MTGSADSWTRGRTGGRRTTPVRSPAGHDGTATRRNVSIAEVPLSTVLAVSSASAAGLLEVGGRGSFPPPVQEPGGDVGASPSISCPEAIRTVLSTARA